MAWSGWGFTVGGRRGAGKITGSYVVTEITVLGEASDSGQYSGTIVTGAKGAKTRDSREVYGPLAEILEAARNDHSNAENHAISRDKHEGPWTAGPEGYSDPEGFDPTGMGGE
jgi:hypothetical protein